MNTEHFWSTIREGLFKGKMTQGVVDTINTIVDVYYINYTSKGDPEHLAYILATAYHESYHPTLNPEWLPVREGFAKTNQGAINAVTKLFNKKKISKNYALPLANGHSYYGRGYVQITHGYNYIEMGDFLGIDLYNNPDLMLDRHFSASALVFGSVEGLFTGKRLSQYDTADGLLNTYQARRVINGLDKAGLIEGYYNVFHKAIVGKD